MSPAAAPAIDPMPPRVPGSALPWLGAAPALLRDPTANACAAPELERYDPDHYEGRSLRRDIPLPARELVSSFGDGRHSCPAQRFSITAIRIAIRRLLSRFALEPLFVEARPSRQQLGAVARAERPLQVAYHSRSHSPLRTRQ